MIQYMTTEDLNILSIIMELSKSVRCCRQDEIFCEDVSFTQFIILNTIAGHRILDMTILRKMLSVDKSTATRLVEPLIVHDLVLKEKSSKDSRTVILKLTKEGRSVHKRVCLRLASFIKAIQTEIPDNKREVSLEGVRIFLNALQNVCENRSKTNVVDICMKRC